jgi:hypothetical protein
MPELDSSLNRPKGCEKRRTLDVSLFLLQDDEDVVQEEFGGRTQFLDHGHVLMVVPEVDGQGGLADVQSQLQE